MKSPLCNKVYITHVDKQFPVDVYFPVQTFRDEGFKQIKYVGIYCVFISFTACDPV